MYDHGLNLSQAILIVNGPIRQNVEYDQFKTGKFVFPSDTKYIDDLVKKLKWTWALIAEHVIKPYHRFTNVAFIRPYLLFITNPLINWEVFASKLEMHWFKLGVRPSGNLYIDMFTDIYNYRNQNKIYIQ